MTRERLLELAKEERQKAINSNKQHGTDYWYHKGRESMLNDLIKEFEK